jgi:hypothetical protein
MLTLLYPTYPTSVPFSSLVGAMRPSYAEVEKLADSLVAFELIQVTRSDCSPSHVHLNKASRDVCIDKPLDPPK